MELKQHPLSAIFPSMSEVELKELAADIKERGQDSVIYLYEGKVLDGWHRYRACKIAGVVHRIMDFKGKDPKAFVRANNLLRRNLTASQRALAVVQISEWAPSGKPAKGEVASPLATVAEMAETADVTDRTIQQAKVVSANGSDELKEAVKDGEVSVEKAAKATKKPKAKQASAAKEKKPKAAKKAKTVSQDTIPKAQYDALKSKYDALVIECEGLRENCQDLADELKTCEAIRNNEAAKEMIKLRGDFKIVSRRRDELMANNSQLMKEATRWRAKAEKLEKSHVGA